MATTDDTLDIQPLAPSGVSHQPAAGRANHPEAAAAARAKIEALHQTSELAVGPVAVAADAKPISPAAQHHGKIAKSASHKRLSKTRPIVSAVFSFLFLLLFFKSGVLLSQLNYLTHKPTSPVATAAPVESVGPEPLIIIPKINVNAPVVYPASAEESQIQKALQNGVAHYAGTPLPGQAGNSVIVGHSSNDWWEPGNYKFAFVLLDKLAVGDMINVNHGGRKHVYMVTESKVVEPTDLSVLQPTPEPTLTLITCTPPGTSWKRLIIRAKLTNPTAAAATSAKTDQTSAKLLPSNAPSFTSQVSQFWQWVTSPWRPPAAAPSPDSPQPTTLPAIK